MRTKKPKKGMTAKEAYKKLMDELYPPKPKRLVRVQKIGNKVIKHYKNI